MERIPYTNDKGHTVYVGPVSIRPGETRMVDPSMLNPEAPAAPAEEPQQPNPLATLLAGNVTAVQAGLEALSAEELAALQALEEGAAKPRKGVLEAIAAERLRRGI